MDAFRRSRRRGHGSGPEQGIALLATLVTLIILGVMVVIMFNTLGGSPSGTGTTIPGETTLPGAATTTVPATPTPGRWRPVRHRSCVSYQAPRPGSSGINQIYFMRQPTFFHWRWGPTPSAN